MKIYSRPINTGETFCTSIKTAKTVFKNTEIKLCFGEFERKYNPYKNEFGYGYYKKKIRGTVVAEMILQPGVNSPLLSFYVLKSNEISIELINDFQNNVLHQLFEIYNQFQQGNPDLQKDTGIWVELLNGKFYVHQFVSK